MRLFSFATFLLGFTFLGLFPSENTPTIQTDWKRQYNKKGLSIYTRTASDGIKEFKAVTILDANLSTAVSVLSDYKNHVNWMDGINKCELVEKVNSQNRYLYYVIPMPWPLKNRDMISNSYFSQSKKDVTMHVKCAPKKKEKTKYTRIKKAEGFWKLIPQKNGKVKLIYQYKADPGGIPQSIVGMFLVDGPRKTVTAFRKELKKAKYKKAKVSWLKTK